MIGAKVMGILNITEDSFYDGGLYSHINSATSRIDKLINDGVDVLDVGACSTRPGARMITAKDEKQALAPILEYIRTTYPNMPISVDTFSADVAEWAWSNFSIEIINDISGGSLDKNMFDCVAKTGCTYVMMHMRGTPETMQAMVKYDDLITEIMLFFAEKKNELRRRGVKNIIIDPGFGFAKNLEQNYLILKKLNLFTLLELPILVGVSRKSMIQKVIDCDVKDSLNGTSIVHTIALQNGANWLRVHDVKEAKECIKIMEQYEHTN